ncbi:hypothetical protein FG386_003262 [Cryptosporidium ryanae]|uniref:uncharacterized protein n=1 Tax=Cryptosporidium ryanae TaxID=515981 RepID=UPI003519DD80|nr:hypothetical protein FG386_003262 [Cryptosporidium ryanae]
MDQTLSPSSSEIMRRASVLVDKLLIKTGSNELVTGIDLNDLDCNVNCENGNETGNSYVKMLNFESNSVTGSDALSALNSSKNNIPSMDIIKKLAGRLKNRDSDAISELNFSKARKSVFLDSNMRKEVTYCNNNESVSNYRSKSASPTSNEYNKRTTSNEFDNNFAQVNESLNELNKRVENLSSNIDDIQDSDYNEIINDNGGGFPTKSREDTNQAQSTNRKIKGGMSEDEYFSQMNVAFLQQERLRMWVKDNAKYSTSISNSSESINNNLETDHIPFSDICYSKKYMSDLNANDTTSSGMINSNILSTTASGAAGQFSYSNDTTVYEFGSNGRNCISEVPKLSVSDSNKKNFDGETTGKMGVDVRGSNSYYPSYRIRSFEPKALRFIRVGNQLKRSITVTPLVESLQAIFSQKSGIERLVSPNLSHDFTSSLNCGYSNMVIITIKDNGENKRDRRNSKLRNKRGESKYSEIDSEDSNEGSPLFSCRECSWNPAYSCPIQ